MGKTKKIILGIIISILSIGIVYGISFYFSFFQGDVKVKNGIVEGRAIKKDKLTNYQSNGYKPKLPFESQPITNVKNLKISLLGKSVSSDIPILLKSQRYYLPLDYVAKTLNFKVSNNGSLKLIKDNIIIDFKSNDKCLVNDKTYLLRGNIISYQEAKFISLSDIEYLFGLTAVFNSEDNSILIVNAKKNKSLIKTTPLKDGKVALLRFEDVSVGGPFQDTSKQTKFKAIGDYCFDNNARFNIAWTPRYINPEENIDYDLLYDNDIINAGFINMMDYLINSGGQVGLHGYTHQSDDTVTGSGSELTRTINNNDKSTRYVVENAIDVASALNIPVHFFESPHYHATKKQKQIIGEYFQYQYEPYSILNYIGLKTTDKNNLFIPTPLGYIKDHNPQGIIDRLQHGAPGFLNSVFYHPYLELDYITIETKNNIFSFTLSEDSILQKLINAFNEYGYSPIHPTDFGN